jgi:hypothetical protein
MAEIRIIKHEAVLKYGPRRTSLGGSARPPAQAGPGHAYFNGTAAEYHNRSEVALEQAKALARAERDR